MASAGPYASLHLTSDRWPRQHPTTQFFTGRMPFLPPNQQRQSTEGTRSIHMQKKSDQRPSCSGNRRTRPTTLPSQQPVMIHFVSSLLPVCCLKTGRLPLSEDWCLRWISTPPDAWLEKLFYCRHVLLLTQELQEHFLVSLHHTHAHGQLWSLSTDTMIFHSFSNHYLKIYAII